MKRKRIALSSASWSSWWSWSSSSSSSSSFLFLRLLILSIITQKPTIEAFLALSHLRLSPVGYNRRSVSFRQPPKNFFQKELQKWKQPSRKFNNDNGRYLALHVKKSTRLLSLSNDDDDDDDDFSSISSSSSSSSSSSTKDLVHMMDKNINEENGIQRKNDKKEKKIPILYESDRILIINKPAGISHHNENKSNIAISSSSSRLDNKEKNDRENELDIDDDDDELFVHNDSFDDADDDYHNEYNNNATNDNSNIDINSMGIIHQIRRQEQKRLWGVHRLDKVTSGILVLAKDATMASYLTKAFADASSSSSLSSSRSSTTTTSGSTSTSTSTTTTTMMTTTKSNDMIQKVYVGITMKRPTKKKQGWVIGSMIKSRDKSWKLLKKNSNNNKKKNDDKNKYILSQTKTEKNQPQQEQQQQQQQQQQEQQRQNGTSNVAKTRFFTCKIPNTSYTCIVFRPYTGKTHQLRVAAKSMSIALIGDPIYSDGSLTNNNNTNNKNNNDKNHLNDKNTDNDTNDPIAPSSSTRRLPLPLPQRTYLHACGISIPSLDGHESIQIWSPPPFSSLFETEEEENNNDKDRNTIIKENTTRTTTITRRRGGTATSSNSTGLLNDVVAKLLYKHSDVFDQRLIEAMEQEI